MAPGKYINPESGSQGDYSWWASLKHGGLLIAPSRLAEYFPEDLPPLPRYLEDRLRRDVMRILSGQREALADFLDTILEGVLELASSGSSSSGKPPDADEPFDADELPYAGGGEPPGSIETSNAGNKGVWFKGTQVPARWSYWAMTGEIVKPRRIWQGPHGVVLPVFVESGTGIRLGIGRGRRTTSRVIEWLRSAGEKIALLTNGHQLRLIYAGLDYDAFAEWDVALWFEEGKPGPQVTALRALLGRAALTPPGKGSLSPLLAAIEGSRKGQAELSAALGERVRQAVELLIREHTLALEALDSSIKPGDIYLAATRVVMRMVIILFAEARDLLPRDNPIYHSSYGLGGLRESLERAGGGMSSASFDRLHHRFSAWPRILALFRLVHEGSPHEALPIPRYGGDLFEPGDEDSDDPVRRVLSIFEDPENSPSDAAVYWILNLLCRSRVKVRQGRGSTWMDAPVDFSDLSSEYVGMLYEGLLDFELRRAPAGEPIVFLNLGDQPALPLSRLEALDDDAVAVLVEKFKQKAKPQLAMEENGGEEESGESEVDDESGVDDETGESAVGGSDEEDGGLDENDVRVLGFTPGGDEEQDDTRRVAFERARNWALRAVKAARQVPRPRSKGAAALREYEEACEQAAAKFIARVVLPGEWFLVRWGGTRKGAGTFYTRPQLAVPTVRRTLYPLAYNPPAGSDGLPGEDAPAAEWSPKTPEEILALKVCDPACGSGSFLIAALRFLTDALVQSLHHHGRIRSDGNESIVTLAEGHPETGRLSEELLPCPPDSGDFEPRLRARLKRYVVERCIYGVDIDPLAVELARLALWIETMDRTLPFGFLDHKIKVGNSLVGCWFDRFRDYPVLAWEREGGDKNHSHGVHFPKEGWTKAIRAFRNGRIKSELRTWLETEAGQSVLPFPDLGKAPEELHGEAMKALEEIHAFGVHESEERAAFYRERILGNPAFQRMKEAFDTWCAIWFWPADRLEEAPTPLNFMNPPEVTRALVRELAGEYRFFHWELEFPDVFRAPGSGFDAIVGNPPWETFQPVSKEYFSNLDPLYRTYGKQEALAKQSGYFRRSMEDECAWLAYCSRFKSLANWVKHAAFPFPNGTGDRVRLRLRRGDDTLCDQWGIRRNTRLGYADSSHPFHYQGEGKPYTYKMFLEQAYALLREGGQMGLIVPSGIYTDKGTTALRKLFLAQCRWHWLFGFENRDKVFDIDSRFKFCPVVIQKGGETKAIQAAFMRRDLADWESGERYVTPYAREQVERFSPGTRAILEIRDKRDLQILEKIYANSVLLGDDSPGSWQLQYAQGDFNMTSDSHLFHPRPWWEAQGYRPDEYGRWLKGRWHEGRPAGPRWEMGPGVILSQDGTAWIHEDEVEDIALPLYEGRMIGQFDFSQKGWVSGKGRGAKWREIGWKEKTFEPQYLMSLETCTVGESPVLGWKMPVMNISSTTNSRTVVAAFMKDFPCNHSLNPVRVGSFQKLLAAVTIFNSWVFDFAVRSRMGGVNLSFFVLDEVPIVQPNAIRYLSLIAASASLSLGHRWFSPEWLKLTTHVNLRSNGHEQSDLASWHRLWALTPHERLRLRCILDAIVAELYGLDWDDLAWILRDCDYRAEQLRDDAFTRNLDPKGFWRVDKERDPELRHTVLTLAAFQDLKSIIKSEGDRDKGIEAFCALNNGEGWMLPETLRLADLGLGHDERAKRAQPVRERMGDRFLRWQLESSPEESWKECELHARNLLGEGRFRTLMAGLTAEWSSTDRGIRGVHGTAIYPQFSGETPGLMQAAESPDTDARRLPGTQLALFPSGEKNLFGEDVIYPKPKRRRRG